MKKLFAILMALALVASFAVTAFATEIPSPTDVPLVVVDFDSQHPGQTGDVSKESVAKGTEITFVAPESEYEFLGFQVEGEDYEVVSGAQYVLLDSVDRIWNTREVAPARELRMRRE